MDDFARFMREWGEHPIDRVSSASIEHLPIPPDAKRWLAEAGLPTNLILHNEPLFEFRTDFNNGLYHVATEMMRSGDFVQRPEWSSWWVLGTADVDGGAPTWLCLESSGGIIEFYPEHEDEARPPRLFVNSGLPQFARSLLAFYEVFQGLPMNAFSESEQLRRADLLEAKLQTIDPTAFTKHRFDGLWSFILRMARGDYP